MLKTISALRQPQPQLEQHLPEHGLLYFDHLNAELQSKTFQSVDQELKDIINVLIQKRKDNLLTWNDLYTFDLILSRLLPQERLSREVWSLRSRYRDVAGLREYEAYLASKPPDLAGQVEEKVLRADIEYLLGEIYLRYAITPINQMVSDRISKRVTGVILVGVAFIIVLVLMNMFGIEQSRPGTLLPVMFIGALGGLMSMQQRYQSVSREGDPIDNISELTQSWARLFLPAINGGIFAVLLYMLIIGGLLKGELFPTLPVPPVNPSRPDGIGLMDLFNQARPAAGSDYAKLIIWSFLAGFAERFVPDTLSRFISRRESESKGGA